MEIKKIVDWYFVIKGVQHHKKKVTFTSEMLKEFIGEEWYWFFFKPGEFGSSPDVLKTNLDKLIITARNLGKTFKVVALLIYLMINEDTFNAIVTRKYAGLTGELFGMFNRVFNMLEDQFQIEFTIKWQEMFTQKKDGKEVERYRTVKTITQLKGRTADALFQYGKTEGDKYAIFYQADYDKTKNRIIYFRGADDPDSSRGLAPNVGYIWIIFHEEFSQETDKGKLSFQEQLVRYSSLDSTAKRYLVEAINKGLAPEGTRVLVIGAANAWDPQHPWILAMLKVIPEQVWRDFVEEDIEHNTIMIKADESTGVEFLRATSIHNTFQFPEGSKSREAEALNLEHVKNDVNDYLKAQDLGYVFPGFMKVDNPLAAVISLIVDAPEMTREELKKEGYKLKQAEFGADPGTVDDAGTLESILVEREIESDDEVEETKLETKLYLGNLMVIENKERKKNKQPRIPNPIMKQMFMDFWVGCLKTYPKHMKNFLEVNMDMSARALRDDFNYEIFPNYTNTTDKNFNGQCVAFPRDERHGFGLEQRVEILQQVIPKTIWDPITKSYVIAALKTLEIYAADKSQPHPRKGKMDIYDILCYAIVKQRAYI